ncbi:hypothetical protein QUF63_13110 [Anaerolineales bacterium HSG25]|nr:hypothetical protein [Anaerolineales bacterium HSG25]
MQDTQQLKSRIALILETLPVESLKILVEFAEFLMMKVSKTEAKPEPVFEVQLPKQTRLVSPRLANPVQAVDFKLTVTEGIPE